MSFESGAVLGRSAPFTEIPRADSSTDIAGFGDDGLQKRSSAVAAGAGIAIAARNGEARERLRRAELNQIRMLRPRW